MAARVVELLFRADNRSAVKAFNGIASASDKTTRTVEGNSRKTATGFDGVHKATGRLRGSVAGLMGTVGLGGLALGFKDVISAGEQWQSQQAQLQNALKNTGRYSQSAMSGLMDSAERLSTHGGFGASQNLQALTLLVGATKSATRAQSDLSLATNISRQSGRSFSTTVRALMMLENGRTTGLARLGIAIPKITTAEDALRSARVKGRDQLLALEAAGYKFTAAQKAQYSISHQITPEMLAQAKAQDALSSKQKAFAALQGTFGGATAAYSRKTAGQISNMRNQWEILQKTLGAGLLPVVNKVLGVLSKLFGWLNKNRAVFYGLLAATAAVSAVLATHAAITAVADARNYLLIASNRLLGTSFGVAAGEEEAATGATVGLGAAMDALPVLALIAGLVLLVTHFSAVQKVAVAAWHWIETAASSTWNWIKGHWPLIAGILLAPFIGPVGIIVALFHKQILGAISSVWHWIEGAAGTVWHALTWPFKEAWKVIKGIANAIVAAFHWVVGAVKTAFHFLTHDTPLGGILQAGSNLLHGNIGGAASSLLHGATFGLLHDGGVVKPKYLAGGGPVGSDTVPGWLTPGEGVVNTRGMGLLGEQGLGLLNGGMSPGQNITIEPAPVTISIDGRAVATAVVRYQRQRNARGSSSLVGGAMLTGSRTA